MSKKQKQLRAVGYCRTSSTAQKDNTSIPTQQEAIRRKVAAMGWEFVEFYVDESKSGKKIAGRHEFQRMMRDAANGLFDVVVSYDVKRFGRDGVDIMTSAKALKVDFGVDLVDCCGTFDSRGSKISNWVNAAVAEDERDTIKRRTYLGRIATARKGKPTGPPSRYPFGRLWDKEQQKWTLDRDKAAMIKDIAKRYLKGERLADLAQEYRVNHSNLHKVLMERSGTDWVHHFNDRELGWDEEVVIKVPPLLDAKTIAALHAKAKANKTYHGVPKYEYVLSGLVYCGHCGYRMQCQTNHNGHHYYRHPCRNGGGKECTCRPRPWVRADELERAVLELVLDFYGNPTAVQKAMDKAIPNREKLQELDDREARIQKQLASVRKRTDQLLDAIADNTVPRELAKRKLEGFAQEESKLNSQLLQLRSERASVPTPELVKLTADHFVTRLGKTLRYSNAKKVIERQRLLTPDALTFKEKRDLVKEAFQGVALDGKPAGVYIFAIDDQADHRHKRWRFEMLGNVALDGVFGKTGCVNESASR